MCCSRPPPAAGLRWDRTTTKTYPPRHRCPRRLPRTAPPGDVDLQSPIPEDLKLPPAPETERTDESAANHPAAPRTDEPASEKSTAKSKSAKTKNQTAKEEDKDNDKESKPPHELDAGIDALMRSAKPSGKSKDPTRIRTDANVVRTQGPDKAGAAAPPNPVPAGPESSAEPETSNATVDRLPVGKQSVAVTVDVQAPESMNRNQEATLKLIVRNTGASNALNVKIDDELPDGLKYVSSLPEMLNTAESHLSYKIPTLAAGSVKVFTVKVKPTKIGPFDHAATVRFETGCRSRTACPRAQAQGRYRHQSVDRQGAQGAARRVQGDRHQSGRRARSQRVDPGQAHARPAP